jgi:hypothetical protein
MSFKRFLRQGAAVLVGLSAPLVMLGSASAASTVTWAGTSCTGGSPNCNWSTTNNWVGGVAPVNGDSVVFNNATFDSSVTNVPINNIANLSLASISFINAKVGSGANNINLGVAGTTVTTSISQSASTTNNDVIAGNLILGGDVTVTGNSNGLVFAGLTPLSSDKITLNGHTFTVVDDIGTDPTNRGYTIGSKITGTGTVTINAPTSAVFIDNDNDYSGTTNIIASSGKVSNLNDIFNTLFGTSTVNISTAGAVQFVIGGNVTISNPINIAGTTVTSNNITAIRFQAASSVTSPVTVTVPNITLAGNTGLSNDTNIVVDITGITANGHCIEYFDDTNTTNTPYTGGPAACLVVLPADAAAVAAAAPGTPDTGMALVSAHPVITAAVTLVTTGALLVVARRYATVTTK